MRLIVAAAILAIALPAMAQDAPPPPAQGAPPPVDHASPALRAARHAAREACAADVVKLCPDAGSDRAKIGECMRSHRGDVSASCRDALGALRAARQGQ